MVSDPSHNIECLALVLYEKYLNAGVAETFEVNLHVNHHQIIRYCVGAVGERINVRLTNMVFRSHKSNAVACVALVTVKNNNSFIIRLIYMRIPCSCWNKLRSRQPHPAVEVCIELQQILALGARYRICASVFL